MTCQDLMILAGRTLQTIAAVRQGTSPFDEGQIECEFKLEGARANPTAHPDSPHPVHCRDCTGDIDGVGLTNEAAEDLRWRWQQAEETIADYADVYAVSANINMESLFKKEREHVKQLVM
jgi:hypothetical protein